MTRLEQKEYLLNKIDDDKVLQVIVSIFEELDNQDKLIEDIKTGEHVHQLELRDYILEQFIESGEIKREDKKIVQVVEQNVDLAKRIDNVKEFCSKHAIVNTKDIINILEAINEY